MDDKEMLDLLMKMLLNHSDNSEQEPDGEMEKLAAMLDEAEIPYQMFRNFSGKQICYYGPHGRQLPEEDGKTVWRGPGVGAVCSVIHSMGSYGHEKGLLEISGLMTEEEYETTGDSVLGSLTAENVFQRIQKHYTENR